MTLNPITASAAEIAGAVRAGTASAREVIDAVLAAVRTRGKTLNAFTAVTRTLSLITTKVKARLAAEHVTSLGSIHVDNDANGIVYLSGTAQSQEAIDTAIRLARDTEHVRDVRSDVTVHLED